MFHQKGDTVTLEMTTSDFDKLLFTFGIAVGAAMSIDKDMAARILSTCDKLNEGNPNYVPYTKTKKENQ